MFSFGGQNLGNKKEKETSEELYSKEGGAMEIEHALKERKEENLLITFKISQNLVLVPVRFLGGL